MWDTRKLHTDSSDLLGTCKLPQLQLSTPVQCSEDVMKADDPRGPSSDGVVFDFAGPLGLKHTCT